MPVRRAAEHRVKMLVINALGVLFCHWHRRVLSSNLYDFEKTGSTVVLIWTQLGPRSVVCSEETAYKKSSAVLSL